MKKSYNLIIIIVLCSMVLSSCKSINIGKVEDELEIKGKMDEKQEFLFSEKNEITGLNPILNTTVRDEIVHGMIFEGLVRNITDTNGKVKLVPGIAEDWDISPDGLRYTFYLREDARWEDGEIINSDDFLYTFRQIANKDNRATNAWLFDGIIENFSEALYSNEKKPEDIGVKAIDGETIEFNLIKPSSSFLELIAKVKPIRQDKYEEWGSEYGKSIDKVITNGQFTLDKWNKDKNMKFIKNKKYWNSEKIIIEEIERKVISKEEEEIEEFLKGNIDIIDTSDSNIEDKLNKEILSSINIIHNPSRSAEFIVMNTNNEFLKNGTIRSAFSIGFDRREFIKEFKDKSDEALFSIVPSSINIGDRTYTDRVDKQNRIVERLGEIHSDPSLVVEQGIWESNMKIEAKDIELTLLIRSRDKHVEKEAEWLKRQWEDKLKVKINIEKVSLEEILERMKDNDFDMAWLGWTSDYNDPTALIGLFDPEKGYFNKSITGWEGVSAKKFSSFLEDASNLSDGNERAYTILEAEKILLREGIVIPIFSPSSKLYVKDFIKGYNKSPDTSVDFTNIYTYGRE